ncbi:hypothetical protein PENTCL1PPCAC_11812, partial [Pristionchus entomophagus]
PPPLPPLLPPLPPPAPPTPQPTRGDVNSLLGIDVTTPIAEEDPETMEDELRACTVMEKEEGRGEKKKRDERKRKREDMEGGDERGEEERLEKIPEENREEQSGGSEDTEGEESGGEGKNGKSREERRREKEERRKKRRDEEMEERRKRSEELGAGDIGDAADCSIAVSLEDEDFSLTSPPESMAREAQKEEGTTGSSISPEEDDDIPDLPRDETPLPPHLSEPSSTSPPTPPRSQTECVPQHHSKLEKVAEPTSSESPSSLGEQHGRVIGFVGGGTQDKDGDKRRTMVWAWGSTGEEKWTADIEIGMDWKSLVRSALLPITTDFFPDSNTLTREYNVQEHQLTGDEKINRELQMIVDSEREKGEFDVIDKDSHRVIYDALICQRLQRGFQIVLLPKELILTSISASIRRNLSSKLLGNEIKAETTLSFSPHYHRIILTERGVYVTLFIPKERLDCSPTPEYPYYFQVPDSTQYTASRTSFKPHNLDKLDWSALDMNFNRRGFAPTFDDEMKPYSCRIMVVPGCSTGDPRPSTSSFGRSRLAAIRRESFSSSETLYTGLSPPENSRGGMGGTTPGRENPSDLFEGMARLLLAMNRLQLEDSRLEYRSDRWSRVSSSNSRHYSELSINDPSLTPTVVLDEFTKSKLMVCSLPTTAEEKRISEGCVFLSYDLICWLQQNIRELGRRERAVEWANSCLLEENYVAVMKPPIPRDNQSETSSTEEGFLPREKAPLIFGYQYCYMPRITMKNEVKMPRYCCVEFVSTGCSVLTDEEDCIFRPRSIDADIRDRSYDYPLGEWARIEYERSYCEGKSYEFSIKWMVACGQTISDTLLTWRRRAENAKLYLFPAPDDVFALPTDVDSNPLRQPIKIRVTRANEGGITDMELPSVMRHLLHHRGFISMACPVHKSRCECSQYYTHWTGGMFVSLERPPNRAAPFYYWAWNHMLSHRYRNPRDSQRSTRVVTAAEGCTEVEQDEALRELRSYCDDPRKMETFARRLGYM